MNFIGSKHRLSDFIVTAIKKVVGDDLSHVIFCDLFARTGIVGRSFTPLVKKVIANDLEYYSYILNIHYIGNCKKIAKATVKLKQLNKLKVTVGFITEQYSMYGENQLNYFTIENAQKIDAIRQQLNLWLASGEIDEALYHLLLTSLIEASNKVANTASVYVAFLKRIKKTAQKESHLAFPKYEITSQENQVNHMDSAQLIEQIEGNILYLDPPYNHRQYGSNYHLLTTLSQNITIIPKGVTGVRNYTRSNYCKKRKVAKALDELIAKAKFKYIFIS